MFFFFQKADSNWLTIDQHPHQYSTLTLDFFANVDKTNQRKNLWIIIKFQINHNHHSQIHISNTCSFVTIEKEKSILVTVELCIAHCTLYRTWVGFWFFFWFSPFPVPFYSSLCILSAKLMHVKRTGNW